MLRAAPRRGPTKGCLECATMTIVSQPLRYGFGLIGHDKPSFVAGYRVLKQKYQDGDGRHEFEWDMTIHGPIVGLKITF